MTTKTKHDIQSFMQKNDNKDKI